MRTSKSGGSLVLRTQAWLHTQTSFHDITSLWKEKFNCAFIHMHAYKHTAAGLINLFCIIGNQYWPFLENESVSAVCTPISFPVISRFNDFVFLGYSLNTTLIVFVCSLVSQFMNSCYQNTKQPKALHVPPTLMCEGWRSAEARLDQFLLLQSIPRVWVVGHLKT